MHACLIQVACLIEVATKTGFTVFEDTFSYFSSIPRCDPSSEPSPQDVSDEGSQQMFLCRIKQKLYLIITKYSSKALYLQSKQDFLHK